MLGTANFANPLLFIGVCTKCVTYWQEPWWYKHKWWHKPYPGVLISLWQYWKPESVNHNGFERRTKLSHMILLLVNKRCTTQRGTLGYCAVHHTEFEQKDELNHWGLVCHIVKPKIVFLHRSWRRRRRSGAMTTRATLKMRWKRSRRSQGEHHDLWTLTSDLTISSFNNEELLWLSVQDHEPLGSRFKSTCHASYAFGQSTLSGLSERTKSCQSRDNFLLIVYMR